MKKLLITFAILGLALSVNAQERREKQDVPPARTQEVQTIRLANELARFGYENASAMALIQAAEMLASVSTQPLTHESKEQGRGEASAQKDEKPAFSPQTLIADAKRIAAGNQNLIALADNVRIDNATRGRVGGPGVITTIVQARATDTYTISFRAGHVAEILVVGDGDTDLDLFVYDSNGNLIVFDDDYTDVCYVRWTPRWTGPFTVKVVNLGRVWNQYTLTTN